MLLMEIVISNGKEAWGYIDAEVVRKIKRETKYTKYEIIQWSAFYPNKRIQINYGHIRQYNLWNILKNNNNNKIFIWL